MIDKSTPSSSTLNPDNFYSGSPAPALPCRGGVFFSPGFLIVGQLILGLLLAPAILITGAVLASLGALDTYT